MDLNIKTTKSIEEISSFIADSINRELSQGKSVLWFVSGGSSIPIEVEAAKKIKEFPPGKLVVTLADERYGLVDHSNSNWFKLEELGFEISGAKFIPILIGKDLSNTTLEIRKTLNDELEKAEYKIGVFGIGIDGHTAGILPRSEAVSLNELICTYESAMHVRITITPKAIELLDEAIVYAVGEFKWPTIEKLYEDVSIREQPAQVLKKVPLLTIFSDYKVE